MLSPDYLQSVYGSAEWQTAWAQDPAGTGCKLLTVRVQECDRPGLLAGVVGIDLFGIGEAAAAGRIRSMVSAAIIGRAKPRVAPEFPEAVRAAPRARFPGSMPRVWKVPARNPNFTGRGPELATLACGLSAGRTVTVQSVHGMGGVGKTQLAAEYAYAHAREYDLVWWITADEPALISDQFAALAVRLGLEPDSKPEVLRVQVHDALRRIAGWLLIFDNADIVADIREWLPGVPLPPGVPGHVIVTTRRGGFGSLGTVLRLDVVGPVNAVRLMKTRVPALDQKTGKLIAEELGRLPLALEQASAYMDRSQMPAGEYLELLRSGATELYTWGEESGERTIATLWDISLERISEENPAAVQLLDVCACLAPRLIPLDLFTEHCGDLPQPLSSVAANPLPFAETVKVAVDYSLVKRTPAGLQMHRLVQAAIRARPHRQVPEVTKPGKARLAGGTVGQHGRARAAAVRALRADAPEEVLGEPKAWPRWAVLLPHVLAVADLVNPADGTLERRVVADTAWLLDRAASYLYVHARFEEARPLLERALAIDENIYGPDHHEVADRLNNLALVLMALGLAKEARPLQERALAIDEQIYGPNHPEVAIRLNNLAAILMALGLAQEARPLQERTLAIDEQTCGPNHPSVADHLDGFALILKNLGLARDARQVQERALAIDERTCGPNHPNVARDLSNLAGILKDLGLARDARPLQERALAIDEQTYGPNHPNVAVHLHSLAGIFEDLGLARDAQPLEERAKAITEARRGPRGPDG